MAFLYLILRVIEEREGCLNSQCGPASERSAVQILDFNGVPAWNGFRSFSVSLAFPRVSSRRLIRHDTEGDDASAKKERSTETTVSFDGGLALQDLVKEVTPTSKLRQTPSKLGQRQAKMLAKNTGTLMRDCLPTDAKASAETEVLNPLEKHYTTNEIADAWNVHPVTVYRDFVDEEGVVKLGSAGTKRRTRRELRIPESVLMRVYDKRRT